MAVRDMGAGKYEVADELLAEDLLDHNAVDFREFQGDQQTEDEFWS